MTDLANLGVTSRASSVASHHAGEDGTIDIEGDLVGCAAAPCASAAKKTSNVWPILIGSCPYANVGYEYSSTILRISAGRSSIKA